MPRAKRPSGNVVPMSFSGICKLCWKPPAKGDRTLNGYHIECAKEAAAIMTDLMHAKRGIVYESWYRRRYPNRPVPGTSSTARPSSTEG